MINFLLIYIAIIVTGNLVFLGINHARKTLPRIYIDSKEVTIEEAKKMKPGIIRVQKSTKKGSIFIPPTDLESERQRIINDRKAQGLDTPVEMLRETNNNEEN